MTNKSKLAIAAAVLALGIASPAFAQSFDPNWGTGNVLPFHYQAVASENGAGRVGVHHGGLESYAMIRHGRPTARAGGVVENGPSAGYEQLLKTY